MSSHANALKLFARRLNALLMLRRAVGWMTVWFFAWGIAVMAMRFTSTIQVRWLALGLAGGIPVGVLAAIWEWRRRESFSKIRAAYDDLNECGGILMAEEVADMSHWQGQLATAKVPNLRWRSSRAVGLLALSVIFASVILVLPDRLTARGTQPTLEIGKAVGELKAEVEALKEEKLLEDKKADETQKQLARLQEQSSALDPAKTWEALDHIKETDADLAKRASEEAVDKMSTLSAAQTLASAMQMAADSGMTQDTATHAAEDLASLLKSAKLEDGLLKADIPPELLAQLDGLNQQQLQKLLGAIQFKKGSIGKTVTNLANLKLIDPKSLSQCRNAGNCTNCNSLAAFLSTCTNASAYNMVSFCYGKGGKGGGGGTGPMTWQDQASEDSLQFKEKVLPPSSHLDQAQFVGVSQSAPELSDGTIESQRGALANAAGSGGSANAQVILPEHRQAIQRFFKRDAQ